MKAWSRIWLAAVVLLSACGQEHNHQQVPVSVPLEVAYEMTPAAPQPGERVTFSVTVQQGEEAVDDAEEVRFELWRDGQEEHEFLDAASKGGGLYTAEKQLAEAGTYNLIYHVTARGFHNMDKLQFHVGEPGEAQPSEQQGDAAGSANGEKSSEQHAGHGTAGGHE